METRETVRESLKARLDELERRMDEVAERAAHSSTDAQARLRSQLDPLRTRLLEVRRRLTEKAEADEKAEDAALAEIGHAINDMYDGLMSGPK